MKWTQEKIKVFMSRPIFNKKVLVQKDSSWPRISIVTPSFNQARFLEKTILSVLNQDYPNLEYIIIDGGSTDGSLEIIRKYEAYLATWVSERDSGQSEAIEKGFDKSTGDILAWLNSDDAYLPGTLKFVGRWFREHSEVDLVFGDTIFVDGEDKPLLEMKDVSFTKKALVFAAANLLQPSTFWRREAYNRAGRLRRDYHYCMDIDLWVRMILKGMFFRHVRLPISLFRLHQDSKTMSSSDPFRYESRRLRKEAGWPALDSFYARIMRKLFLLRKGILLMFQGDVEYLFSRVIIRLKHFLQKNICIE